jgi:hypothetical protein
MEPCSKDEIILIEKLYNNIILNLINDNSMVIGEINPLKNNMSTSFNTNIPKISLTEYMQRLVKYINIGWKTLKSFNNNINNLFIEKNIILSKLQNNSFGYITLIYSLIYLQRLVYEYNFIITTNNIHKALLSCYIIALKFLEDEPIDFGFLSKVGGVSIKELKNIEINTCFLLNFHFTVTDTELETIL